ncbi:hypothetical protein [Gulosibacter faecalis]|uniref:Uncharacterized protein n=2 Tax=Gulosibacter faecalis TaxID=272240 RepID=A0ABW5UTX9_9MICO
MFEAARLAEESLSPRGITYEDELNPANARRFKTGNEEGLPEKNYAVIAQRNAEKAYEAKYGTKDDPVDMTGIFFPVRLLD